MTLMIRPMCTIIIITSYVYKHQLMELSTGPENFTSRKALDLHVASQGSSTRKVLFRISPTCRTKRKTRLTPGFLFEVLGESSRKEKLVTLFREQGFPRASVKLCLKFMCTQRPSLGWSRYSVHYRSVCRTQKKASRRDRCILQAPHLTCQHKPNFPAAKLGVKTTDNKRQTSVLKFTGN
jgi:hypothetical protein